MMLAPTCFLSVAFSLARLATEDIVDVKSRCAGNGTEPDDIQRKRLFAHTSRFLPSK